MRGSDAEGAGEDLEAVFQAGVVEGPREAQRAGRFEERAGGEEQAVFGAKPFGEGR